MRQTSLRGAAAAASDTACKRLTTRVARVLPMMRDRPAASPAARAADEHRQAQHPAQHPQPQHAQARADALDPHLALGSPAAFRDDDDGGAAEPFAALSRIAEAARATVGEAVRSFGEREGVMGDSRTRDFKRRITVLSPILHTSPQLPLSSPNTQHSQRKRKHKHKTDNLLHVVQEPQDAAAQLCGAVMSREYGRHEPPHTEHHRLRGAGPPPPPQPQPAGGGGGGGARERARPAGGGRGGAE